MRVKFGEYRIRDWAMEDAPAIVRYADNRRVSMWLRDRFPSPYTLYDAEAFLLAVAQQNPRTAFAIATNREAIGGVGLELGRDVHRFTAELGYWLGEPFWGQGIMTDAVRHFTDWAFGHLEPHRIYAGPRFRQVSDSLPHRKTSLRERGDDGAPEDAGCAGY